MFKKIDVLANVSLIVVSIVFGFVLVRKQLLPSHTDQPSEVSPGVRIPLTGVDWKAGQKTLLLVVSNQCHFCSESAAFYRRLAAGAAARDVHLIALLPQPVSDGREYMKSLDVPIQDVRQVEMQTLNVRGTPTLVLVDQEGIVRNVWRGKLPAEKESEVMTLLEACAGC